MTHTMMMIIGSAILAGIATFLFDTQREIKKDKSKGKRNGKR